ncbi:Alanine dehydrogenase [Candidatus Promineifilum breve]|uniref:alanine dehydrogenase n=1 Tax=Candidatus Promineifilum breve TaxID=1806508 RepID=A0A160SZ87_9CHLR|nr:alanine dehydrogenase [Candidatus Promineifilum breve]CUS02342.2 Alanine dehydrogenase [Candidatus Promineifilum breve]
MEFSIPKEVRDLESRVGLTPAGVSSLVRRGHTVYVEKNAGVAAGFSDETYRHSGARVVYSAAEAYGRADVVVKVTRPTAAEHTLFRSGQTIMAFLHMAVASPDFLVALHDREITAIAYEMIERPNGARPILVPMSEVAGRLAPMVAGQLLMTPGGGRGTLLSGIPGVPRGVVVIIGGGVLGANAARAFLNVGAQVVVLDNDISRLQHLDEVLNGRVTTMLSTNYNLDRVTEFADVIVGAVLSSGRRAPIVITREMVSHMRPGAVFIDFSIDQGGCSETSRPTTLRDQTYIVDGVIHYCVPNLTAAVARTTSYGLTNSLLPYLIAMGEFGILGTLERIPEITPGLNLYQGKLCNRELAQALGKKLEISLPHTNSNAAVAPVGGEQ